MKVKYLGISDPLELLNGKIYDVVAIEGDWYRIEDETREDYLYPPQYFEVVEPQDKSTPVLSYEECARRSKLDRAKEEYRKPHEVFAFAPYNTKLETPVGAITIEKDNTPAEFEALRLFDRYSIASCTTYFIGIATSFSKRKQEVSCIFSPSGHGSCFAASGDRVESVGYDTDGYILHISISYDNSEENPSEDDYEAICTSRGLTVSIPAKAPAQQLVFGVSWIKTNIDPDGTAAWISSDPNYIGECWPNVVDEATNHCPVCGNPLVSRSKRDACGSFCTKCDWCVITQPYRPMEDDHNTYEITLLPGSNADKVALSTINKLLCCGFTRAKEIIESAPYKISKEEAPETLRIMEQLSKSNLNFSVTPDFPHHVVKSSSGKSIWSDFEDGDSIDQEGSEGGRIIYDVEFIHGARVTIEETNPIPFSITCGIYGLMAHTTFADSKEEAIKKAYAIQGELADCIMNPPSDEGDWCESFVSRW